MASNIGGVSTGQRVASKKRAKAAKKRKVSRLTPCDDATISETKDAGVHVQKSSSKKQDYVEMAKALLDSFDKESIVIFTDGSALKNPGPAGSGAYVQLPGCELKTNKNVYLSYSLGYAQNVILLLSPSCFLTRKTTNNVAELTAIYIAIDYLLQLSQGSTLARVYPVEIVTDSEYAQNTIEGIKQAHKNVELIEQIQTVLAQQRTYQDIRIHWVLLQLY